MNGACPASVTLFHCRFPWQGSALNLAAWAQCPVQGTILSPADCTLHSSSPACVGTMSSAGYPAKCTLHTTHSSAPAWAQCPVQGTILSLQIAPCTALPLRGHKPTMSIVQCKAQHCVCTNQHKLCTMSSAGWNTSPCRLCPAHYTM